MDAAKEQAKLWNRPGGQGWTQMQKTLDRTFQPFEDMLVAAVADRGPSRVLDVGCGAGSTTLVIARRLGAHGSSTGIDLSEVMIAAARARAAVEGSTAAFVCADAQVHPFHPGSFDTIISRFGVMFFEDPVEAFTNLRSAAAPDACLYLLACRSAEENPFMTLAERAAAPLLPDLPARHPAEPGQFAFADPNRVRSILEQSGWSDIQISPVDAICTLPETELDSYLSQLGPVGRVLQAAGEQTRARIIDQVRPAFAPYVYGADVRFEAACWMITARASLR